MCLSAGVKMTFRARSENCLAVEDMLEWMMPASE